MTHLPPHSKEKGFTPEDDQGEGMSGIPEMESVPLSDPVDDDWMEPTTALKFVKNEAGQRILHQLWRGRSSLKREWRPVPEEA